MDQRNIRDIQVTWQLGLFIAAVFALPISLAPIVAYIADGGSVPASVLSICGGIALALVLMVVVAVRSRLHQAEGEQRPDGQPMPDWILHQVLIGLLLCLLGAGIMILLAWLGATMKIAAFGCILAALPGITLIGRAMVPMK